MIFGKIAIISGVAALREFSEWINNSKLFHIRTISEKIHAFSPLGVSIVAIAVLGLIAFCDLFFMAKSLQFSSAVFVLPSRASMSFVISTLGGVVSSRYSIYRTVHP